jgi:hypothetical protein
VVVAASLLVALLLELVVGWVGGQRCLVCLHLTVTCRHFRQMFVEFTYLHLQNTVQERAEVQRISRQSKIEPAKTKRSR